MTYVLLGIVVLIALVIAYAATRPNDFQIERSARISASPARIVSYVEDFHHWPQWSPFEKLDPAMTRTYSGAAHGVGAVYTWSGNNRAGEGRMEIVHQDPSRIGLDLQFTRPFKARNPTDFLFVPEGDATRVTWRMRGVNPFMMKLFGMFMSMDKMVGKDFESGLASLKSASEGAPPTVSRGAAQS